MGWKVFQYSIFAAGVLLGLWFAMHIGADSDAQRGLKILGGLFGFIAAWQLTKLISWVIDRCAKAKASSSPQAPAERLSYDSWND